MPFSSENGKHAIAEWVEKHKREIADVIDFGAGSGNYGKMLLEIEPAFHVTAVEIFETYIDKFNLYALYDKVICGDMRKIELPEADLAICGDVLEHCAKNDAVEFLHRIEAKYTHVIVSIPIGTYLQGPVFGNVFEKHLSFWSEKELYDLFIEYDLKIRYNDIAVFIRHF